MIHDPNEVKKHFVNTCKYCGIDLDRADHSNNGTDHHRTCAIMYERLLKALNNVSAGLDRYTVNYIRHAMEGTE
jgi:hypothetical protein